MQGNKITDLMKKELLYSIFGINIDGILDKKSLTEKLFFIKNLFEHEIDDLCSILENFPANSKELQQNTICNQSLIIAFIQTYYMDQTKFNEIKKLLQEDSTPNTNFIILSFAVQNGQLDIVKELLLPQYNINLKKTNNNGDTPLIIAVENGNLDFVKELIKHGANVNKKNLNNTTPLMFAVYNGNLEIIEELLNKAMPIENRNKKIKQMIRDCKDIEKFNPQERLKKLNQLIKYYSFQDKKRKMLEKLKRLTRCFIPRTRRITPEQQQSTVKTPSRENRYKI